MSGFTPTVKYEIDFDGEHVTFVLRRLKVKHRSTIMRATSAEGSPIDRETTIAETAQAVLPECVVSISGLTVEGKPVSDIKEIIEEAYFLGLMDRVLAELLRVSHILEVDAKNSAGPSGDTSKA